MMSREKSCSDVLGQCLENSQEKIEEIDKIEIGDHLGFRRPGYDHHVIVVDNDNDDTITITHFDGPFPEGGRKARIVTNQKRFSAVLKEGSIYKVVYGRGEALSTRAVLRNAERIQREFEQQSDGVTRNRKYNLFLENCEHFAYECKTGQPKSVQVKNFVRTAAGLAANGVTDLVLLQFPDTSGVQTAGTVASGLIEVALTWDDINRFNEMLEKKQITEKQWEDAVVKRVVAGICAVLGKHCGQKIGVRMGGPLNKVLWPLLGDILGRWVGSNVGEWLGLSKDLVQGILEKHEKHSHVE